MHLNMSLCPPFESFSPGDVVFDLECLLENIGDLSYDRQTGEG